MTLIKLIKHRFFIRVHPSHPCHQRSNGVIRVHRLFRLKHNIIFIRINKLLMQSLVETVIGGSDDGDFHLFFISNDPPIFQGSENCKKLQ
jgi:hypothetical protein